VSEDRALFGLHPGSDLLAQFSLEKNDLESLEIGQVLSLGLVVEFLSESGGRPLLIEAKSFNSLYQFLSLLSSVHSGDSELGESDSLDWDELSFDVGSWTIDQDLISQDKFIKI
jgi:hypothetical protein